MKGFIEDDFLFGSFFTYLERAIADFFCTLSAAESSAGLKCWWILVSNMATKKPTPSSVCISCRIFAFAAKLASTVTT